MQSIHTSHIKHARKNISLDVRTASQLAELGRFGESYNDIIFNLAAALSTISYDYNNINNNASEKEQIVLDRLFEIINRVNESIDRIEQVQRSQAWMLQQISKLSDEVKQLKKGVLQQQ